MIWYDGQREQKRRERESVESNYKEAPQGRAAMNIGFARVVRIVAPAKGWKEIMQKQTWYGVEDECSTQVDC